MKKDYERFLLCLKYYRFQTPPVKLSKLLQMPQEDREGILANLVSENHKIIELVAFCLMPNHFHLLLRQEMDQGISDFMQKITNSYTRYFNTKHKRVGPVFQGAFKAVHVETDGQLLHLSRYIHLNPLVSFIVRDQDFLSYPWSSLNQYLEGDNNYLDSQSILNNFSDPQGYLEFVKNQVDYGRELERIKHLTLE